MVIASRDTSVLPRSHPFIAEAVSPLNRNLKQCFCSLKLLVTVTVTWDTRVVRVNRQRSSGVAHAHMFPYWRRIDHDGLARKLERQ